MHPIRIYNKSVEKTAGKETLAVDIDYNGIGLRIRELRRQRHWTQAHLAEVSEVEPSNISHIERGATKLSLPTLVRLADALDTTPDVLLYGSLRHTAHITNGMINELVSDCTDRELVAIAEIIRTTKRCLR